MTLTPGEALGADRLLTHARQLYHNLAGELAKALRVLNSGVEDEAAKGRADTIRAHRKALQTVLDLELQLARDTGKAETTHEIDIEAARTEIHRRLARLAISGGD
ncbi:MAG: hypothetical protein WD969_14245 [Paracoccaceae bacterium]